MNKTYSVADVSTILGKNNETVLRYIRKAIATENDIIIAKQKAANQNKQFKDYTAINNDINLLRSSRIPALCVKVPIGKSYEITEDSLIYLLRLKKYAPTDEEAKRYIAQKLNMLPTIAPLISDTSFTKENIVPKHKFIPPIPNGFLAAFSTKEEQEKYFKGLYLLQNIDKQIDPVEVEMLRNREKLLGVSREQINSWIPDIRNMSKEQILPEIHFSYFTAHIFITEAYYLAFQDERYYTSEESLIIEIAQNNDIDSKTLELIRTKAREKFSHATIEYILD